MLLGFILLCPQDFKDHAHLCLVNSFDPFICLQNPKWNPPSLDEVNPKEVEEVFEPLGPGIGELEV